MYFFKTARGIICMIDNHIPSGGSGASSQSFQNRSLVSVFFIRTEPDKKRGLNLSKSKRPIVFIIIIIIIHYYYYLPLTCFSTQFWPLQPDSTLSRS